jgi:hypothetical protein
MLVHAFLQDPLKQNYVLDAFGITTTFVVNSSGHCVGEVTNPKLLQRLMQIPEGYCLYDEEAQATSAPDKTEMPEEEAQTASKYTLVSDGQTIDLRTLDRAGLLAFIAEQSLSYTPRANTTDAAVRDKIVSLLTGG